MTPLVKVLLITALLFVAINLFFYGRYRRVMAEVRRRLEEEEKAKDTPTSDQASSSDARKPE